MSSLVDDGTPEDGDQTSSQQSVAPPRLNITARQRDLVERATEIEAEDVQSAGEVGYVPRLWTQLAMPYRDPGEVSRWERRNGRMTLIIRPATLVAPDGTTSDGYPYGVIPRYLMAWMATEAVRTKEPHLNLGGSLADFIEKVGLAKGGAGGRRLKNQIHRLVGSTIQIQEVRQEMGGQHVSGRHFNLAESFELWFPDSDLTPVAQGALWNNTITLSEEFFESIVSGPVPVDLRVLRALTGSPMKFDIYTWLTYRMSYLSKPTLVPWAVLEIQFGAQFARSRDFRQKFAENVHAVKMFYPHANIYIEDAGVKLYPSKTSVPRRATTRKIGQGK